MYEIAQWVNRKGKFATAILKYPTGRYGIVGSIPAELTEVRQNGLGLPYRGSLIWDTEQEVVDALLSIGITHFQLADCSWYGQS